LQVGETVTVEVFEPGQQVKVSGTSKGKGFQGTIKRHNFKSGPKSHGSHNVRAPGSIGASATPSRVFKGIRGPGRMGGGRVTQRGLTVVEVIAKQNLLLLRGAVPGPRGGTVEVRTDG
jgi:large subunit ribosomal protein L3